MASKPYTKRAGNKDDDSDYENSETIIQNMKEKHSVMDDEDYREGQSNKENERPIWDVFRKQEIFENSSVFDGFAGKLIRAVTLLTYIILCTVVFGGTIIAKASLQVLSTFLYEENIQYEMSGERTPAMNAIRWFLILIIFIPELLVFLTSVLKILFGERDMPLCAFFVVNLLKDILHIVGVCAMVFKVMPYLGPVQMAAVITTIPIIPGLVHTCWIRRIKSIRCKKRKTFFSIIAVLLLLAAFVTNMVILSSSDFHGDNKIEVFAWTPLSMVLVSLRSIETYFSKGTKSSRHGKDNAVTNIKGLQFTILMSSIFRITVGTILIRFYFCTGIEGIHESMSRFSNSEKNWTTEFCLSNISFPNCTKFHYIYKSEWTVLPYFLVHFFTAFVVFRCAVSACQMRMQKVCFTIPLWTATPCYVLIVFASSFAGSTWFKNNFYGERPDIEKGEIGALVAFIAAWLAQMWIGRHVWKNPPERLTFKRKLFALPHYCSPVLDIAILHSRKRNRSVRDLHESIKRAGVNKVYVCATMWHENRTEMKQILTSLFRLDLDQCSRKLFNEQRKIQNLLDTDYYEFEGKGTD